MAAAGRALELSLTARLDVLCRGVYLLGEADFRRIRAWCAHAPVLGRLVSGVMLAANALQSVLRLR